MKVKKMIFYILMFLPLLVTIIVLPFLPDQIPAHYGFDNQVTRWGSKYETLIFPVITIIFGLVMLGIAKYSAREEKEGGSNEKICIITGIFSLLLFNVMTGYFLYTDINKVENLSSVSVDISQFIFIFLGIFMVMNGIIMPKIQMNSVMGLRTPWSMKNEITWKKSQRFGSITFMITGILIILVSCFTRGFVCVLCSLGIVILSLPIDIYYTYKVAKKYESLWSENDNERKF